MSKKRFAAYGATLLVLLVLDAIWLGLVAASTYHQAIGHLMADMPNLAAAGVFYLVYPLGLMVFAVAPPWPAGTPTATRIATAQPARSAALAGALFGFFAYATYDLSNLATLRGWPVHISLIDIAWGTVLSATAAWAGRRVLARMA